MSLYTLTHPNETSLEVVYERDGEEYAAVIEPRQLEGDASPKLGVTSGEVIKPGLLGAFQYGAYTVRYWINYTFDSLRMLVTGQLGIKDMSGPVGIVSAVDSVYQAAAPSGIAAVVLNMLNFGVLVTANLGIMNLLPIPALDGWRIFVLLFEGVTRKKPPAKFEWLVNTIGLVLLLGLMCVVTFSDITKLF